MFTKKDLLDIDIDYFEVLSSNAFHVAIRSRNTNHEWYIESREVRIVSSGRVINTCIINHRHDRRSGFHPHGHASSLVEAQVMIKDHDKFHLNGRK